MAMPGTHSSSPDVTYHYDDDQGAPVEIDVFTFNGWEVGNLLQQTDPFGVSWPEFTPTGKATPMMLELGGFFKSGTGSIDELFADRVPEPPDAQTRTFKMTLSTGRERTAETHLLAYTTSTDREQGLTRWSVRLQVTGAVTETVGT